MGLLPQRKESAVALFDAFPIRPYLDHDGDHQQAEPALLREWVWACGRIEAVIDARKKNSGAESDARIMNGRKHVMLGIFSRGSEAGTSDGCRRRRRSLQRPAPPRSALFLCGRSCENTVTNLGQGNPAGCSSSTVTAAVAE